MNTIWLTPSPDASSRPPGSPINVGVVIANVEMLVNIARAAGGKPVTHKTLTVAGAVRRPATMTVPIGVSFRECIEAAGGATTAEPVLWSRPEIT